MADPPGNRLRARFPSNVDTLRPWTAERMGSQRIHPAHAREISPSRSGSPSSTDRATVRRISHPRVSGAGPQSTGTIPRLLPGERRPEIIAELSDLPARWSPAPRSVGGRRGEPSAESFLEQTSMAGSALARGPRAATVAHPRAESSWPMLPPRNPGAARLATLPRTASANPHRVERRGGRGPDSQVC